MTPAAVRAPRQGAVCARRRVLFFALAAALGGLCTLIAYPGIFYSDSYGRWFMARELARYNFAVQDDWLSVPPQLFMAALYKLTQNYASFTLVQSVLFFFTAFCAIDAFCPRGRAAGMVLFAACPVFYGFAVYVEMGVGCLIALLWLLMLLLCVDYARFDDWPLAKKWGYFLACLALYFVMLGFRQNAFTVLPVAAFLVGKICFRIGDWLPGLLHALAAALCVALIASLPSALRYGIRNGAGSLAAGFLWETVSVLGEVGEKPAYADYLDYLGEAGTTQKAIAANHEDSIYGYHAHIPNTVVGTGGHAARILRGYLNLALREPQAFWTVKGRFAARTLGISQPLSAGEYDYDRDGRMAEFGFADTARRRQFHQSYHGFLQAAPLLRMPWLCFLLAAALLLAARRALRGPGARRLWALYAAAAFFYAAMLVTTQSQEFRYFFVPLALLYIVSAGSAGALCGRGWDALRARRRKHAGEGTGAPPS